MSSNSPFAALDSDVSPALLPLASQQAVAVSVATTVSSSAWTTGDYKISAQAADHADPTGGQWLLCDSSAIDGAYTSLIALVGANRPDARGRTLVMQGTNASVSSLLANDGQAVANRRPHHRTSLTDPGHVHTQQTSNGAGAQFTTSVNSTGAVLQQSVGQTASATTGVTVGTGNANDALDTPSFLVPGNLFVHT